MSTSWPPNFPALLAGEGCTMCAAGRPEADHWGVRILRAEHSDAYLQRADIQRGYTVVIWRGRHVAEPTDLTPDEAAAYWLEVLRVARALQQHYRPLKMNYETLGNALPHLHTHLVPRYVEDPAPGRPFPLLAQDGHEPRLPEQQFLQDVAALRQLLNSAS